MATETEKIQCIGFIMDGNRRWAKKKSLHLLEGHIRGAEVFKRTARWLRDHKIPHGVFYAFSTENWHRAEHEISYLMALFEEQLDKLTQELNDDEETKVKIRFIGNRTQFTPTLRKKMDDVEESSSVYTGTTVWIAVSYSGRGEITRAVNKAVENGKSVDENTFGALFESAEMPDPDIIVRTGGQQRLSNFLPWQSVYSELIFLDVYWPDLTGEHLEGVIHEYDRRVRNFGK